MKKLKTNKLPFQLLNIPLFAEDVSSFFRKLIYDSIISRETFGTVRYDMIHLLMLAKKGSLNYENDQTNNSNTEEFYKFETSKKGNNFCI